MTSQQEFDPYAPASDMHQQTGLQSVMARFGNNKRAEQLDAMQQAARDFFQREVDSGKTPEAIYHNLEAKLSAKQTAENISAEEFVHLHDDLFQTFKQAQAVYEQQQMDKLMDKTLEMRAIDDLDQLMNLSDEDDDPTE